MTEVAEEDAFIHTETGLEGFSDSVADALKNEDVFIIHSTENVRFIDSTADEQHRGTLVDGEK